MYIVWEIKVERNKNKESHEGGTHLHSCPFKKLGAIKDSPGISRIRLILGDINMVGGRIRYKEEMMIFC